MPGHRAEGHEPDADEATEAIIEGDLGFRRGTAQAALRNRDFRIFWGGTFASNIGTWMQNVLLGAFGYELTGSAVFVGVLFFAQLGPLLFMSTVGGVLADVVDRRKLLIITQIEQLVLSIVLAVLAASGDRRGEPRGARLGRGAGAGRGAGGRGGGLDRVGAAARGGAEGDHRGHGGGGVEGCRAGGPWAGRRVTRQTTIKSKPSALKGW